MNDVTSATRQGHRAIEAPLGTVITPLAWEVAREQGVDIRLCSTATVENGPTSTSDGIMATLERFSQEELEQEFGDSQHTWLRELPSTHSALHAISDIESNLFWAAECLQAFQRLAQDGVALKILSHNLAAMLSLHVNRLQKWRLKRGAAVLRELARYFGGNGPTTSEEFAQVCQAGRVVVDQMLCWLSTTSQAVQPEREKRVASTSGLVAPANPQATEPKLAGMSTEDLCEIVARVVIRLLSSGDPVSGGIER